MKFVMVDGPDPLTYAFTDSVQQSGALATTWTFTNRAIGAAAANRWICVTVNPGSAAVAPSSVTVGGVSATPISGITNSRMWLALVPSGTTATVVVTFGSNQSRVTIGLYAIYGQLNTTPFHVQNTSGTGTTSVNLNVEKGGVAICWGLITTASPPSDASWSGVTENFDIQFNNAPVSGRDDSGASDGVYLAAQTVGITLAAVGGGGTPVKNLSAVSLAPLG